MTVIAHLTDIHLPSLSLSKLSKLNLKQGFGLLNWQASRHKIHQQDALDLLLQDLDKQEISHTIISGDLTNLALPSEIETAESWLKTRGTPQQVSYVPGNHDYYDNGFALQNKEVFKEHMRSCDIGACLGGGSGPQDPYVRVIDKIALIGLNSAIPTPLFKSFGAIEEQTLEQLSKILKKAQAQGLYRCVVLHHPPLNTITTPQKGLNNDAALTAILKEAGAELVLYGHTHLQRYDRLLTQQGFCHVIGTPSASVGKICQYNLARYNLFDIQTQNGTWHTTMIGRGLDHKCEWVVKAEQRDLK